MADEEKKEKGEKKSSLSAIVTRETVGLTLALFSAVALIILFTGSLIFGSVGTAIRSFLFGLFGFMAFFLLAGLLYLGVTLIAGKNFLPEKAMTASLFTGIAVIGLLVHAACTASLLPVGFGEYLSHCFTAGEGGSIGTPFGLFGGLIAYPFLALTTPAGTYILFLMAALLCVFLFVRSVWLYSGKRILPRRSVRREENADKVGKSQQEGEGQPLSFDEIENTRYQTASPRTADPVPLQSGRAEAGYSRPDYLAGSARRGENRGLGEPSAPSRKTEGESPEAQYMDDVRRGAPSYESSRRILYGTGYDPIDYHNRNLIFDSSSCYNRRTQSEPTENTYGSMYSGEIDNRNAPSAAPKEIVRESAREYGHASFRKDVFDVYDLQRGEEEGEPLRPSYHVPESPRVQREEPTGSGERIVPPSVRAERDFPSGACAPDVTGQPPQPPLSETESRAEEGLRIHSLRERFRREDGEEKEESGAVDRAESDFSRLFDDEEEKRSGRDSVADEEVEVPLFERRAAGRRSFMPPEPPVDEGEEENEFLTESSFAPDQGAPQRRTDASSEPPAPPRVIKDYVRPPLDLLDEYDESSHVSEEEKSSNMAGIIETLALFNIKAEAAGVTVGPTFTRYDLSVPLTVNAKDIAKHAEPIARQLRLNSVNVETNFEMNTISIEVPNRVRSFVGMRSMLTSPAYVNAKKDALAFCVGKNVEGETMCDDICKMPHMLVAGTTGSGKSVFLHSIIISLLMKYSPEEVRLILIDPKHNEFLAYSNLPHLLINEIFYNVDKIIVMLNWLIKEMENRYTLFAQLSAKNRIPVRSIDDYNSAVEKREDKLPKIVVVADEVADLMLQKKGDVESRISRLAAKARACGIHLILATQQPSVNVITGVLKANLPARFALSVTSQVNSMVILGEPGAENLLGKGDLLYKTGHQYGGPQRVQAAVLQAEEIQRVCDFIRDNNESYFNEQAATFIDNDGKENDPAAAEGDEGEVEPVYIEALRYIIKTGSASISMIQRKCNVGYNKAGKIVEWMEINNYISQYEGAKSRSVLITKEQFEERYGEL